MKNVRLFLSTVVAFLVVGISTVNAQQKQSVIVSETISKTEIIIEIVKPDYSVDTQKYTPKEENSSARLKKELDKWLEEGFEIKESTTAAYGPSFFIISYVLVKEQ